jgi:ABC-type sugar transport system permease subunit
MTDSTRLVIDSPPEAVATRPAARRRWLSRSQRDNLVDLAYAAPQYILYLALLVLPFLIALPIVFSDRLDFLDRNLDYVGLANFTSLFEKPMVDLFVPALWRTALFTVTAYFTVFLFGFLLALAMYELTSRLKGMFFTVIYMPWMVSGISIGLIMVMLFSHDTGTANLAVEALGLGRNVFDAKTETAVVFALPFIYGWKTAGFNMALFLGGLLAIPPETIESSKLDGANYLQRVIHVYIPQMVPSIIIATIFSLINGFGLFDELVGLGGLSGNSNARFLSILIYELGFAGAQNYGAKVGTLAQGITVSLVVFVPLVVIAYFLNRLQRRLQYH